MLAEMEQEMQVIKKNFKVAQDRKKSYAYQNRMFKEYQVGEWVYLRIKPKRNSFRIGLCAKLAPQYCGPFNILDRIGPVAYPLALPLTLKVHDVFHVSFLKKYVKDVDHVIDWFILEVELEGEFQLESNCILHRKMLVLWNQEIEQVKVKWNHFGPNEATWEMVHQMWAMYPSLFAS